MNNDIFNRFVDENYHYLQCVMENAPHGMEADFGLTNKTFYRLFHKVLKDRDFYYLPFCLLAIHDGTPEIYGCEDEFIRRDEEFASEALKYLHENTQNKHISYCYAYSLRVRGFPDEGNKILHDLADLNYASALLTLGELEQYYTKDWDKEKALMYYKRACDLGHLRGRTAYLYLKYKDTWVPIMFYFKCMKFCKIIFSPIKIPLLLVQSLKDDKYIYIDFLVE